MDKSPKDQTEPLVLLKDNLKTFENKYVFDGVYSIYTTLFAEYLNKEYSNVYLSNLVFIWKDMSKVLLYKKNKSYQPFRVKSIENQNEIPIEFIEEIKDKKERFFVYLLVIDPQTTDSYIDCIIWDKLTQTFEIFEPYGILTSVKYDWNTLYSSLYYLFTDLSHTQNTNKDITFYIPANFLPEYHKKIQQETSKCDLSIVLPINTYNGFSLAWTFFYIEQRIKYPDIDRLILTKSILEKIGDTKDPKNSICYLISNYTDFVIGLWENKKLVNKIWIYAEHYLGTGIEVSFKIFIVLLMYKIQVKGQQIANASLDRTFYFLDDLSNKTGELLSSIKKYSLSTISKFLWGSSNEEQKVITKEFIDNVSEKYDKNVKNDDDKYYL